VPELCYRYMPAGACYFCRGSTLSVLNMTATYLRKSVSP